MGAPGGWLGVAVMTLACLTQPAKWGLTAVLGIPLQEVAKGAHLGVSDPFKITSPSFLGSNILLLGDSYQL